MIRVKFVVKKSTTKKSVKKATKIKGKSPTKESKVKVVSKKDNKLRKVSKKTPVAKPARYWQAVGRRKRSVARVRLFTRGEKEIIVNGKQINEYFPTLELQNAVTAALKRMKSMERFRVTAKVNGGGIRGQADAVRHGTARALVKFNPDFSKRLRKAGYLTRDSREKERRKYGLKKARKAPQWQKR